MTVGSVGSSPAELRSLHSKKDGAYQLFIITPQFGSRGVDFRSVVPPTLMILGQFSNDRDAYQCYHRVGRFGEAARRCGLAGLPLVSERERSSYVARLMTDIEELTKKSSKAGSILPKRLAKEEEKKN